MNGMLLLFFFKGKEHLNLKNAWLGLVKTENLEPILYSPLGCLQSPMVLVCMLLKADMRFSPLLGVTSIHVTNAAGFTIHLKSKNISTRS